MTRFPKILLSVTALTFAPFAPALAADYEPPVVVNSPDQFVPVEVGTGWYLRGDVAYGVNHSFKDVDFAATPVRYSEEEHTFSGSIGFGYHFTDWLRADLNLGYLPGNKISGSYNDGTIDAAAEVKNSAWYGMVNAYADLGTYVGITPYVGAGAGLIRSNPRVSGHYDDTTPPGTFEDFRYRSTDYSFAYTLNAGLSYAVTKDLSVDLGYQYLSAPDAKTVSLDTPDSYSIHKGIHYHQIRLGLRYDLW
ncbi:MAG: outer membrane protein [Rhizobiaceae bacterium]